MVDTADDYTEFNADYPCESTARHSTHACRRTSSDGSKSLVGDMQNPKVQVYGDTAVLTYNFVGVAGTRTARFQPKQAKSTRVYANRRQVDAGARQLCASRSCFQRDRRAV